MKKNKNIILQLFLNFAKIGLFTFGGGYAMIPLIQEVTVNKKKWIDDKELVNIIAIAESTPGPIAVNSSTYIGYKLGGLFGALTATFGVVLPSFVIIFIISLFLDRFMSLTLVANAFKGIQVAVGFLIIIAGVRLIKKMKKNVYSLVAFCVTVAAMFAIKISGISFSSLYLILIGAMFGFVMTLVSHFGSNKHKNEG